MTTAPSPVETDSDLHLLEPENLRLFRSEPGSASVRATVENDSRLSPDRSYIHVRIARAFPFSKQNEYLGLRDGADKDIGLLTSLTGLDGESRQVLEAELERRYFMPVWKRTLRIKEQFGVIEWEMETDRGSRTYLLRNIKEAVQHLSSSRVLISDPEGNRFEVGDTSKLDPRAYEIMGKAL
ncbi:MAG: DUF1854 domain-containing protein [Armatimonadetes bacterium]|nr:DUF1854 domain-containing protein [Armatimonadota bacterium]